jgi:hypothetical protein
MTVNELLDCLPLRLRLKVKTIAERPPMELNCDRRSISLEPNVATIGLANCAASATVAPMTIIASMSVSVEVVEVMMMMLVNEIELKSRTADALATIRSNLRRA